MHRYIRYPVAILVLLAAATPVPAGAPGQQGSRFRADVNLVVLGVSVTDAEGNAVRDLKPENFVVAEEGESRPIELFSTDYCPLDVAILVDASASMIGQMPRVRRATAEFIATLRPDDQATIYSFQDRMRVITADEIATLRSGRGATALYDALYVAVRTVGGRHDPQRGELPRRRAVIVLSDGIDTSSLVGDVEVGEAALRRDVAVYPIVFRQEFQDFDGAGLGLTVGALASLAQRTGGLSVQPASWVELREVYQRIRRDIGERYLIGYAPPDEALVGGFRRVQVQVLRGGVVVRARQGYVAGRSR